MRLALFQPDIAANFGAVCRLAACFAVPLDVVEPCGFPLDEPRIRRAAMDYFAHVELCRYVSWADYLARRPPGRLVLLTTGGDQRFPEIAFAADDTLLCGRESAGVPPEVHARADLRLRLPLAAGLRSLNVAVAASMVLGEALRQTGGFPVSD